MALVLPGPCRQGVVGSSVDRWCLWEDLGGRSESGGWSFRGFQEAVCGEGFGVGLLEGFPVPCPWLYGQRVNCGCDGAAALPVARAKVCGRFCLDCACDMT